MNLNPSEDRRANRATALSMLLSAGFVVVAVVADATWLTAILMVLAGLTLLVLNNLLGIAVFQPALRGSVWTIWIVRMLWPSVPVSGAIYMAGVFTLIIKAGVAGWSAIFLDH